MDVHPPKNGMYRYWSIAGYDMNSYDRFQLRIKQLRASRRSTWSTQCHCRGPQTSPGPQTLAIVECHVGCQIEDAPGDDERESNRAAPSGAPHGHDSKISPAGDNFPVIFTETSTKSGKDFL